MIQNCIALTKLKKLYAPSETFGIIKFSFYNILSMYFQDLNMDQQN